MAYINKIDNKSYKNIVAIDDIGFNTPNEKGQINIITKDGIEYERKSQTEDKTPVILTVGQTYKFDNYDWIVAEEKDGYYVFQSKGVTGGTWPGYKMAKFGGSANTNYGSNIDGQDISDYDTKTTTLYSNIKAAEKTGATYGTGLYLITNTMAGTTSNGSKGSGQYYNALLYAATNRSSFGAGNYFAWLGTVGNVSTAWSVESNNSVTFSGQKSSFVIAPAFNLDPTKVKLIDNEIIMK